MSSSINIHSLPSASAGEGNLREDIEAGLMGTAEPTVPGSTAEDSKWAFRRSVPTMVLYDEQGLRAAARQETTRAKGILADPFDPFSLSSPPNRRLYDGITANAPEYYLFPDELNLLKSHGDGIARSMGFPGKRKPEKRVPLFEPEKPWRPARWGDVDVGKWNNGVNGEQGLGGGWERGYDVVELGAGALRKTAYLLTSLSSALPACSEAGDDAQTPITYHPLDLSKPELSRVLGEMNEEFGAQLQNKVDCIGLHGDYEAGLQFIREGKLPSLRDASRARGLEQTSARSDSTSPYSVRLGTPDIVVKEISSTLSPMVSPSSESVITPGLAHSPLPSAIDSISGSDTGSGTWSPIESEPAPIPEALLDTTSSNRPLHLVFLGSSLGNFPRDAAAPFLHSLPLRGGDTLLLGLDGRPLPGDDGRQKVEIAYNDPAGHTRAFEEHGWDVVRDQLGLHGDAGVEFVGRYNEALGRHEAFYRSKERQTLHLPTAQTDITLEKDELLNIEWSYKVNTIIDPTLNPTQYSQLEALRLFKAADLRVIDSWKAPDSEYRLWLLERPSVRFTDPTMANSVTRGTLDNIKALPKWEEWRALWKLWDHITLEMIPEEMLHQKPIDLRHICLFYLGHIPTFLDIHLTRMTNGKHTEPEHFKDIFERGIDPDVDDPTKIHSHSAVPVAKEDWPALDEILAFRDRVRDRVRDIYQKIECGELELTRHMARVLFMTHEHEAQHAETLLYMLIQSPTTRAPTTVAAPQWDILARRWNEDKAVNQVLTIEAGEVSLGHHDLESEDELFPGQHGWEDHEFGWDIEHPQLVVKVANFKIDTLPVSNNDYSAFLKASGVIFSADNLPASWVEHDGEWQVRTLYGPVGFDVAGLWPLAASKNEFDAYAKSKGGRMPTEMELRTLWEHPEGPRQAGDLANVGFKAWHPIPPANTTKDNSGKTLYGHNGGYWEWTSTDFTGYEGFVPSLIYPGYSADFFDGKHFVVIGGSFATIPKIAERKSFRNWYQANYRFSFITGRVAYDF